MSLKYRKLYLVKTMTAGEATGSEKVTGGEHHLSFGLRLRVDRREYAQLISPKEWADMFG